jgi:hypothetical protein
VITLEKGAGEGEGHRREEEGRAGTINERFHDYLGGMSEAEWWSEACLFLPPLHLLTSLVKLKLVW